MIFENKTVVLTGVGRPGQLGEVVAGAFAARGARLVVVDVEAGEAEARAAAIRAAGGDARGLGCDLTDAAQVAALAGDVGAVAAGRVDALVNMAGGFAMSGPVDESEVAVWHRMIEINLTTAYVATRAFLPLLRSTRGAIVYFASAAVLPGGRGGGMAAYAAAKSGVLALMRAVADEERETGVRANAIAPTTIRTAANVAAMGDSARYVEREAVAETVLFLCSDRAGAITGQAVRLA
ncbi:MAG: SDR family oxidoreductase [Gemmatimonadota bacterium]|nr:SDR family oxidoreductase [Gemmatimonadota bacterium]